MAKGVRHIWLPSSSFVISDALQQPVGAKVVGLGWLNLLGPETFEYMQITPLGSVQYELTQLSFYRDLKKAEQ